MGDKQIKVLAIDDHPDNLITIRALIGEAFPEVQTITAESGREGIALAQVHDPDVILLDVIMPEMDGFEVCLALKADRQVRNIPVVFVTALKGDRENRIRALEAGAEGFLNKPIDESELAAQIRAMVKIKASHCRERSEKQRLEEVVQQRTVQLIQKITELEKTDKELRFANMRLGAFWDIATISNAGIREICDHLLASIVRISGSLYGFYGLISDNETVMTIHSWSGEAMKGCSIADKPSRFPIKDAGIWGEAVRQRKPLILNDFSIAHPAKKGLPSGHVPLTRLLVIPVFSGGSVVSVAAVANRGTDYTEDDVRNISAFAESIQAIVDRKMAEENLREMEVRLRQSEKMEAIGQLAGGIAHDFNNILGGIIGYADMSLDHTEKGSVLEKNLDKILKGADRAKNLVKQILTFSRQDSTKKVPTDLRLIIKEALSLFKASIPSSVIVKSELDTATKPVLADPTKIHELLINLATNAVYAMNRKGDLTVRLYTERIGSGVSGHTGPLPPGEYAVIEVRDTGSGMTPQVLQKAFDPFYTTKPVGEGTGLGLPVVMGVVQSHGGNMQVETEPGKGTTFRIFLPMTEDSVTLIPDERNKTRFTGTEHILVVDDEEIIADMAKDLLESLGYGVTSMTDSLAALELIRNDTGSIDILITDQTMPGMTGIELAREVKIVRDDLPVILCTGFSRDVNAENAATMHISRFITKPYGSYEIGKAVREVLDECRSVSASESTKQ